MTALSPTGNEFLVNTTTTGDIFNPNIGALLGGGFAAVWVEYPAGNIRLQRFAADGDKIGQEILVAARTADGTWAPAVTGLASGGFVVTWRVDDFSGPGAEIKAQIYDANAAKVGGEIAVNTTTAGGQYAPQVTPLGNGGFVVAWWDGDPNSDTNIRAQVFSASGAKVGGEIDVNGNASGKQFYPDITTLANGNTVVVWEDFGADVNAHESEVYAQILDASGAKVGGAITVNTTLPGQQWDAQVAPLLGGGFVVAWHAADSEEGEGGGVMVQRFNATGGKVGAEIMVRAGSSEPAVSGLGDGGFIVAFSEYAPTATDNQPPSTMAQVFDASGAAVGDAFQLNAAIAGGQSNANLATLTGGSVAAIWQDFSGALGDTDGALTGQVYSAGGTTPDEDEEFDMTGPGGGTEEGGPGDDVFIVDDIEDEPIEAAGEGIDTVKSSIDWTLGDNLDNLELTGSDAIDGTGNALANTITGNGAANALNGGAGNDSLVGGGGADTLTGSLGDDTLVGGAGNDTYVVSGKDQLSEASGGGTDTVKSGGSFTLGANLEKLILTGSANAGGTGNGGANTLSGNAGANSLSGLGGADTLFGLGGNDALRGGTGNDTLNGGGGNDAFVFDTALNATGNVDRIADFVHGADRIRLDDDVFTALAGATALTAAQFRSGAGVTTAADADDRILYDTSTGALYYDRDGNGSAAAAIKFAVLAGSPDALSASDFAVIG
jgi:Ca2+-binding RTX toxin-like protein